MHDTLLAPGRVTLLDLLDRVLETGVVIDGEIDLSVADINLVHLGLSWFRLICDAGAAQRWRCNPLWGCYR